MLHRCQYYQYRDFTVRILDVSQKKNFHLSFESNKRSIIIKESFESTRHIKWHQVPEIFFSIETRLLKNKIKKEVKALSNALNWFIYFRLCL